MKAAALTLLLCAACAAQVDEPGVPTAILDLTDSVLFYQPGEVTCTAVAIGPTTALTARHCIDHDGGGVTTPSGTPRAVVRATPADEHDLATLEVDPSDPFEVWAPIATRPIEKGDLIQMWGYGCGGLAVRAGQATGDHSAFAVACPGDSGGPVLGYDGVAGIIHGQDSSEGGYIGFAPLAVILVELDALGKGSE